MPLELIVGAVVGAGLVSQPVRKALRKGVVHGLAGVLTAYDAVSARAASMKKTAPAAPAAPAAPSANGPVTEPPLSSAPTEGHPTPVGSTS
jgi:hypothetical protein